MKRGHSRNRGFSLIEVVIAIGVMAYAVFGVLGLLPVGIKGFQNATCGAAGSDVLSSLSVALRSAQTTDGTNFDWSFNGTACSYIVGGTKTTNAWSTLSLEGVSSTNSFYRQLAAVKTALAGDPIGWKVALDALAMPPRIKSAIRILQKTTPLP